MTKDSNLEGTINTAQTSDTTQPSNNKSGVGAKVKNIINSKIPPKKEVNPKITELEQELAKAKDQTMRLAAELENFKRRSTKEIEDANKYALTKFARELLEVLENLYRAEASIKPEDAQTNELLKQLLAGVQMTRESMDSAFDKYAIKRVHPKGQPFNHDLHQAITQIEADGIESGIVVEVVQSGYTLNDRLLRPALVTVAK